ncbi:unnamed protein product [marine sediment metagenome]|uniref:Uncharacterized protein n=1 Tax=marine sediment metagenome TaxID=412755 RepID=X1TTT9_9ZZZZ
MSGAYPKGKRYPEIDAEDITSGILALARLSGLTKDQLAAAAGLLLTQMETAVCSETEAKSYVTREFFVPVTYGTLMGEDAAHPVAILTNANDKAFIAFGVPHDYTSMIAADVIVIPKDTLPAVDWSIYTKYGALAESYIIHEEVDMTTTYDVISNILFAVDIRGLLTSLLADDYVGVEFRIRTADHDVNVLGVRFKYS